jgi:hypothetical protein
MCRIISVAFVLWLFLHSAAWAQDTSTTQPVSRQEFDQLKQDNAEMKQELADIKKQQSDQASNAQQDDQDYDKAIQSMQSEIAKNAPGQESLVIAGDANFGFSDFRNSTPNTYFADVSPLILWQPEDPRLLVEAAFDLGIGGQDINSESSALTVNLADISYDICDYCVVGGGLFAVPFGQYHNHFDPPWVDKFPDDPLAFDAIAPVSEVGFYAKGAIPAGTTKWTYDIYTANGPNLITADPTAAGQLNFDDFTDLNDNKAFGGRIGFLPFPDMEMGYSLQSSNPSPGDFQTVHAFLQAVDFHYKPVIHSIEGQLDFSGEWIWSDLSPVTYDPTGSLGFGPLTYNNNSQGGYVSLCYRPTESDSNVVRNVEFCARYDTLETPLASPGGDHETRWTFGVDYWFTSYCVLKTAYEFDSREVAPSTNAFLVQIGIGL